MLSTRIYRKITSIALLLTLAVLSMAQEVYVFCFCESDRIHLESSFSSSCCHEIPHEQPSGETSPDCCTAATGLMTGSDNDLCNSIPYQLQLVRLGKQQQESLPHASLQPAANIMDLECDVSSWTGSTAYLGIPGHPSPFKAPLHLTHTVFLL